MRMFVLTLLLSVAACTSQRASDSSSTKPDAVTTQVAADGGAFAEPAFGTAVEPGTDMYPGPGNLKKALFAGGCFWCMEPPFEKVDGVLATVSGYAGGPEKAPEYKAVASGKTGHTEAVLVVYDPAKVDYAKLLDVFWRSHDPTDAGGQFADRGSQYRPAVFVYDETQEAAAQASKRALDASKRFDKPIVVEVVAATTFWPAEEYHQDFYKKDPGHYKRYARGSGREGFLDRVWKN